MKLRKNVGMLLLAAWFILNGLVPLLNPGFSGLGTLMAILAVAAGVLIIVGRQARLIRTGSRLRLQIFEISDPKIVGCFPLHGIHALQVSESQGMRALG